MKAIENKANAKAKKVAAIVMAVIAVIIIISFITGSDKPTTTFTEVGYYTAPNKFRVHTFHVSDTNFTEIRQHGDKLFTTKGCSTVAFYYADRDLCHNLTTATTFGDAIEFAYNNACVAEYWKNPNGEVIFKQFPVENFTENR